MWFDELFGWREKEWGASILVDVVVYCLDALIDTCDDGMSGKGFAVDWQVGSVIRAVVSVSGWHARHRRVAVRTTEDGCVLEWGL